MSGPKTARVSVDRAKALRQAQADEQKRRETQAREGRRRLEKLADKRREQESAAREEERRREREAALERRRLEAAQRAAEREHRRDDLAKRRLDEQQERRRKNAESRLSAIRTRANLVTGHLRKIHDSGVAGLGFQTREELGMLLEQAGDCLADLPAAQEWLNRAEKALRACERTVLEHAAEEGAVRGAAKTIMQLVRSGDDAIECVADLVRTRLLATSLAQEDRIARSRARVLGELLELVAILGQGRSAQMKSLDPHLDSIERAGTEADLRAAAIAATAAVNELRVDQQQNAARLQELEKLLACAPGAVSEAVILSAVESVTSGIVSAEQLSAFQAHHSDAVRAEEVEQRALDRDLVASNIEMALENLGYTVDPIGATFFPEGGKVYATKPGWGSHFVEITGSEVNGNMQFRARCVSEEPERALGIDTEWCDDLHLAGGACKENGIDIEIVAVDRDAPSVDRLDPVAVRTSSVVQGKRRHPEREKDIERDRN